MGGVRTAVSRLAEAAYAQLANPWPFANREERAVELLDVLAGKSSV
jgi:hypothetical protein